MIVAKLGIDVLSALKDRRFLGSSSILPDNSTG